ncbi:MAG: sigma-70 family RNA polymerase sigma factor [Deltaproteobacteria bacterium]|nr:sigma-70 family RNA polymerase sigma factor [Deltaproteobacteria bacterium]
MKDEIGAKGKNDYERLSDRELIQMFLDGDIMAFNEFYRRYYGALFKFIISYCGDTHIAEDTLQEVFLKLLGFKVRLGLIKNIKKYLYSIAVNRCRDMVSARKREMVFNGSEREMGMTYNTSDVNVDIQIMNQFVDKLPQTQREVLLLRTKSDLQFSEIGEILGISENSAKVNYFYAVTSLKKMMGGEY